MGAAVPAPSLDSRYRVEGVWSRTVQGSSSGRSGPGSRHVAGGVTQRRIRCEVRALVAVRAVWKMPLAVDVRAGEGGVQVGGFGVGACGVEGDDGVAAPVLQPLHHLGQTGGGVEGGGEQGAGEDLFPGGVEERVASGAADGGHEVPGQPAGGFDPVGVGDLADRP